MENLIHSPIGLTHVASASVALVLGTLALAFRKGTLVHKRIGYAYVFAMLAVNATAFGIYKLFGGFGLFHFFAIVSLITMAIGMLPFLFRWKNGLKFHISQMYYSVLGLYAAFFAETAVRVPASVKTWAGFWVVVMGATVLTFVIGTWVFVRKYKNWTSPSKLSTTAATVCIFFIQGFFGTPTQAQKNSIHLGYQLSNVGGDFGNGLQVGWINKSGHFGIKLNAAQNWLAGIKNTDAQSQESFHGYQTTRIAFEGSGYLNDFIRLYGGGGPMLGFVNNVSSQIPVLSGFGFWGFGFRANRWEYFLELGGSGGFNNADKLQEQPLIGTGFYLSVGQRVRLGK